MTTEAKLKVGMVLSVLTLLWSTVMWSNSIETVKLQSNTIDSLHDELFILNVELGRHELTRDYFFGKHPKLQLEYENYLHHETE